MPHKSTPEEARAKRNEYGKKWRRKLRHDVLSNYSKKISNSDIPCCNCCGENEFLIFLTIDHITNRRGKYYQKNIRKKSALKTRGE